MSKELDYIADLERENRLLGERCNQLLKDKGDLIDQIADIKANCDLAIEGRDVKIKELEQQIEKMKCCANCKSFKGYGETCEGWGEPVLNPNCDCTEWELRR